MPSTTVIIDRPVPVALLRFEANSDPDHPDLDELALLRSLERHGSGLQALDLLESWFRGAPFALLDRVLATGIDVDPPTAAFYAGGFHKASGYGGWPKLILALAPGALDRSFRRVPADSPPEELAALRETFPTVVAKPETASVWLSRQRADSTYVATPLETDYGFWVPDPARRPLRALFIATHPQFGGDDGVVEAVAAAVARGLTI